MWLCADLEARRRGLRHPRRQAGKRAVRLKHDDELDAAALEPPPDADGLAVARMEAIGDAGSFSRLFVGSMSLFRATLGSFGYRRRDHRDPWQSCAEARAG